MLKTALQKQVHFRMILHGLYSIRLFITIILLNLYIVKESYYNQELGSSLLLLTLAKMVTW